MDSDTKWLASLCLALAVGGTGCRGEKVGVDGFCVFGDEEAGCNDVQDYAADRSLTVTVLLDTCLNHCEEAVDRECDVSGPEERPELGSGLWLTIEGGATVRQTLLENCDASCEQPRVACETPPLSPGTYGIVSGAHRTEISVPSTVEVACAGDSGCIGGR